MDPQCASGHDVLFNDFRADPSCLALKKYNELGLSLADLLEIQKILPILYPWDSDYLKYQSAVNRRFTVFPIGIVMAATREDVVNGFNFARKYDLPFSLRGGSHNAEGYCLSSGIIIDQSKRTGIHVDHPTRDHRRGGVSSDKRSTHQGGHDFALVTLEAGALIGPTAEKLAEQGLAIPSGTCPNVGQIGLALAGGIGFLTREFGLTADSVVSVELITASGEIIVADEHHHPDLFWALRGSGGGNYGIVLSMVIKAYYLRDVCLAELVYSKRQAAKVLHEWEHWAPYTDYRISSDFVIRGRPSTSPTGGSSVDDPPDGTTVTVEAEFASGDIKEFTALLEPMLRLGPKSKNIRRVDYLDAMRNFAGEGRWQPFFKLKNGFVQTPMTRDTMKSFLRSLNAPAGVTYSVRCEVMGLRGAVVPCDDLNSSHHRESTVIDSHDRNHSEIVDSSRGRRHSVSDDSDGPIFDRPKRKPRGISSSKVASHKTSREKSLPADHSQGSFAHRDSIYWVLINVQWTNQEISERALNFADSVYQSVAKSLHGAYVGQADAQLEDYLHEYYGDSLRKLIQVKREYDPHNIFRYPQGIPV